MSIIPEIWPLFIEIIISIPNIHFRNKFHFICSKWMIIFCSKTLLYLQTPQLKLMNVYILKKKTHVHSIANVLIIKRNAKILHWLGWHFNFISKYDANCYFAKLFFSDVERITSLFILTQYCEFVYQCRVFFRNKWLFL